MNARTITIATTLSFEAFVSTDIEGRCPCGAEAQAIQSVTHARVYADLTPTAKGLVLQRKDQTEDDDLWEHQRDVIDPQGAILLICANEHRYVMDSSISVLS